MTPDTSTKGRGGGLLRIVDAKGFADAICELQELVPALMRKETWWRLKNSKQPNVRRENYDRMKSALLDLVDVDVNRQSRESRRAWICLCRLEDSVLSESGVQLVDYFHDWASGAINRFFTRRVPYWIVGDHDYHMATNAEFESDDEIVRYSSLFGLRPVDDQAEAYGLEAGDNRDPHGMEPITGTAAQRAKDFGELRASLVGTPAGDELEAFREWARSCPASDWTRSELAEVRILAPLLEGPDSAWVERSWQELDEREMFRFVRAGVQREKILLDRPHTLERIQGILKRDTHPIAAAARKRSSRERRKNGKS